MIYARLLLLVFVALAGVYYLFVVLQCFDIVQFTKRDIAFHKALIPFYYFFTNNKTKKNHGKKK